MLVALGDAPAAARVFVHRSHREGWSHLWINGSYGPPEWRPRWWSSVTKRVEGRDPDVARPDLRQRPAAVLVVGAAKGGVGASVLTVMIGTKLAQKGPRVLLVDGSQNLGNLHVLLGVSPRGSLHGILTGATQPDSLVQSVTTNLWLLPADSGDEAIYALNATDRARLHYQLSTIYEGFDIVIVDAGPGLESVVRASAMGANRLLVVLMSEPSAIANSHALVKIVSAQLPQLPISVITNQTRDSAEGAGAFEQLVGSCTGFLKQELEYLGCVPDDVDFRIATREGKWPGRIRAAGAADDAISRILAERPWVFGLGTGLIQSC